MPSEVNITYSSLESTALLTDQLLDFVVTSILVRKMGWELFLCSKTISTT